MSYHSSVSNSADHYSKEYNNRQGTFTSTTTTSITMRVPVYFYVCRRPKDVSSRESIKMYEHDTLEQLKDTIYRQLHLTIKPSKFSLSRLDRSTQMWLPIDESNIHYTNAVDRIPPRSILSIEEHKEFVDNYSHTNPTVQNKEFTLQLCKKPMKRLDTIDISVQSSQSLGDVKKQAQERVSDQNTDYLYRWIDENWVKYEQQTEDITLAELDFNNFTTISFQSINRSIPGVCGLTNLGNTCFMNSAFQCLSHIPPLTKEMFRLSTDINAPLIGAFVELIKTLWSGDFSVTSPSSLLVNIRENLPRFARYRQCDAQEFMSYFLDNIHQEFTNDQTLISNLFYGKIRSDVTCSQCQSTETNDETISFLPLPVDSDIHQYSILFLRSNGKQQLLKVSIDVYSKTINDLIKSFIDQHDPNLSLDNIRVVEIKRNEIRSEYSTWQSLYGKSPDQLAFIELPQKTVEQRHIELHFHDHQTHQPFRPPVCLVRPTYVCRYEDIIDQINEVCKNISLAENPFELFWVNYENEIRPLKPSKDQSDYLYCPKRFIIEVDSEWVSQNKDRCNIDLSLSKPTLTGLLDDFFREEPLDGDYFCSTCQTLTKVKQKANLIRPFPPVLIIQLKRFTYDCSSNEKIDTYIEFPLKDLNLSHFTVEKSHEGINGCELYDLVAVSNHRGSLISGHYTTYAKNHRNKKWYSFNDERCEEIIDDKDVITKNAYILVYVGQDHLKQ